MKKNIAAVAVAFITSLFLVASAWAQVAAPSGTAAVGINSTTIRVTATDNADNEDGFFVFRSNQQGSGFVKIGEAPASPGVGGTITYDDSTLTHPSGTKHYRLTAFKKSIYIPEEGSDISNGASGATISSVPPNQNPVANNDSATGVAPVTLSGNVLTNDTDPDGNSLTVQQPNADITSDGSWSKTFNSQGVFDFPYVAIDGFGGSDGAVLTVTIDAPPPINQNPVATDNTYTVQRDQQLTGNVITDSPADSDPDGDPLSVDPIVSGPFILQANGAFTFTPPATGTTFAVDYTLHDNQGGADVGRVDIAITEPPPPPNNPPVAVDDFDSEVVDVAMIGNVLDNDTDADGDTLTVQQPNSDIAFDGTYNITKSVAGIYNIPYTVLDGQGSSDDGNLQLTVTVAPPTGGLVAFPGAEGYGQFSKGGRGGTQMFVTNLNDTGAGSLRACMEASGPRNCIFRVSGVIAPNAPITISQPFISVDFQTAPGQGILLRNGPNMTQQLVRVWTHDVTIRHGRFASGGPVRNAPGAPPGGWSNGDSLLISGIGTLETSDAISNIMLDHNAFIYATDENLDISPWYDKLSVQNSIIARGLKPHSKGPNFRGCGVSLVDSLIADNTIRNPNNTCGKSIPGSVRGGASKSGQTEFRNNVVSNGAQGFFDFFNGRGEGWTNVAGNVFKRGPDTLGGTGAPYPVDVREVTSQPQLADNGCPGGGNCANWKPAGTTDPQHICVQDNADVGGVSGSRPAPIHGVLDPRDATAVNVTDGTPVLHSTDCVNDPATDPTEGRGLTGAVRDADANPTTAMNEVLDDVGPFYWNRDSITADIIADVISGTGFIPTCGTGGLQCSGIVYPTLAGGTPYPDADNDGMDDNWEIANGVTNPNGDVDGDGYTNYEEFAHELATQ